MWDLIVLVPEHCFLALPKANRIGTSNLLEK